MYGVDRSVVMLSRLGGLVGNAEGRARLEVNGRVGVQGDGRVALIAGSVALVMFVGLSQAVYINVSHHFVSVKARHTLFVSI
jgi:hypothetical protein